MFLQTAKLQFFFDISNIIAKKDENNLMTIGNVYKLLYFYFGIFRSTLKHYF